MEFQQKDHYEIQDLLDIMKILRSPEGCPWDREQTHHSIRSNFIEETYEAIEAIDTEDRVLLQEELGDVLLQVIFLSLIHIYGEKQPHPHGDLPCGNESLPPKRFHQRSRLPLQPAVPRKERNKRGKKAVLFPPFYRNKKG